MDDVPAGAGERADTGAPDRDPREGNRACRANITYPLDGPGPGKYVLPTILRDRNADKAGAFDLPTGTAP